MVCVTTFLDLMNLYDAGEFKVGIYVNNGQRNFESLNNPRMLHVHVNHGESDKLSSFTTRPRPTTGSSWRVRRRWSATRRR